MHRSHPIRAVALAALLALGGAHLAFAQDSVPVTAAEGGRAWFVELGSAPTADGTALATVRAEKEAFRREARAAGIRFTERRSFDVLFNGLSIEVDARDRARLAALGSVKAIYPVEVVEAPTPERADGTAADLASAIDMTGARIAQDALGLSGKGVRVGIIDTGIDIDHPAFGGSGTAGGAPFPSARVAFGHDFVGDGYNSTGTPAQQVPVPDPNPDDCAGHGTHVAGIVGANGGGLRGVAPNVTFGAYRVFGCTGTSSSDVIVAALERAYADGMQVINQSLGAARQWPQYPTAQASTRLVNKGVVMVASIGNSGPGGGAPDGLFSAGAPGTGAKVIGVGSFDNTQSTQLTFRLSTGSPIGYGRATGSPPSPTSGVLPLGRVWNGAAPTPATAPGAQPTADGCTALPAGTFAGQAVLVRRGTCTFYVKALNAQQAGAAAVVLYNNQPGAISPTVAPPTAADPAITIPVVSISAVDGVAVHNAITAGGASLTWTAQTVATPVATGGLISSFSSFGLAADLTLKPQLGAPGGLIYSAYPLEQGAYATLSGTSMSAPHVAGGVALILEANPKASANGMVTRLQNAAEPRPWSGNPGLGLRDHVHRQGAGMLDIVGSIRATTQVEPSQLSLGESQAGPRTVALTVKNEGSGAVTYDLSHVGALSTDANVRVGVSAAAPNGTAYGPGSVRAGFATVAFGAPSVTVPAGGTATVEATITAPDSLPERAIYGGYLVLTPQGGGKAVNVPFAGMKGDYQATQVLTPTSSGFPWLAQASGASFLNRNATGGTFSMVGADVPNVLLHLDHLSRRVRLEAFDAVTGKSWHRVSDDEYVSRNSTPGGFFAYPWDGTTFSGKGRNAGQRYTVPNGQYVIRVSVLKALGDESNPDHWETWTSPTITIARP